MATIIVTKEWLKQNNKASSGEDINISFPRAWINNPSLSVGGNINNNNVVKLRLPLSMLEYRNNHSGNKDPNRVNISMWGKVLLGEYPNATINAMKNKTAVESPTKKMINTVNTNTNTKSRGARNTKTTASKNNKATVKTQLQSDIQYQERETYVRYPLTYAHEVDGLLSPQSVNNPTDWFYQYNEPELYGDVINTAVEPLLEYYSQIGNSFIAKAGMVVYDHAGGNPALIWRPINMSQNLRAVYYDVQITPYGWNLHLFDWQGAG